MSGQRDGAPSTQRASARERRPKRRAWLPDKIAVACPPGTRKRIEAAAEHDGLTPAEWMRAALRASLEAARKRQARAAK